MKCLFSSLRIVPVTLVMGTIFFLSHQPANDLQFYFVPGLDKLAHIVMYGVLAATALYAVPTQRLRSNPVRVGIQVVIFCLVYGMTDEFHQSFIQGREPSLGDIAADVAGAALLVVLWLQYFSTPRQPKRKPVKG